MDDSASAMSRDTGPLRPIEVALLVQGVFYLITGVWPLVHVSSFLAVTGPETDLWLVQTVGVLIATNSLVLLAAVRDARLHPAAGLLGLLDAAGLCATEIVFVSQQVIAPIYLVDALVQALFALTWLRILFARKAGTLASANHKIRV